MKHFKKLCIGLKYSTYYQSENWKSLLWCQIKNIIKFSGYHNIHMRSDSMFDTFIDINDDICQSGSVPKWNYSSKYSSYPHYCQHGTNIPGTVGKIYTLIFSFFRKRVDNITILELGPLSNESPGNSTFCRAVVLNLFGKLPFLMKT